MSAGAAFPDATPYSNSSWLEEGLFAQPSANLEMFAALAVFVILCATAHPSPIAAPVAFWLVYGVDDATWQAFCRFWASLGFTEYGMVAWGIPGLAAAVYWVNGLLLLLLDSYVRPEVMTQFKIQKEKSFDTAKLWKVTKNILIGQIFVTIPTGHFYAWLSTTYGYGIYNTPSLPTCFERFCHILFYAVSDEFVFYYGHRWLHENKWERFKYNKIHKIHHEFTSPIGLTASYCHPVEMLISNVLPLTGGMLFCNSHLFTGMSWAAFAVLGTQTHHCGYRWPWTPAFDHQPDFHDYHHKKFNTNYGLTGWCDAIHGTDRMWHEMLAERQEAARKAGKEAKSEKPSNAMYIGFVGLGVFLVLADRYAGTVGELTGLGSAAAALRAALPGGGAAGEL